MEELKSLIGCGHQWAEDRALMALALADQHATGAISPDEYKELLEDLIRTDVLESEASNIEVKNMLVYGVYALLKVV